MCNYITYLRSSTMTEDDKVLEVDIFQKFRLYKQQQTLFDREIEEEYKNHARITLGVDKASEAEERELHLVKAVEEKEKVPTKKSTPSEDYSVIGYHPSLDYYVYKIDEETHNILYDLTDDDFVFCDRTEDVTEDQLEFCLTTLDVMFPYKYRTLNFQNERTLETVYEALRRVYENQKEYNIFTNALFPTYDVFLQIYRIFSERRRANKNEPLIPALREKVMRNKEQFFLPYCEELRRPPKTNSHLREMCLLYNEFAEFAAAREVLNMEFYVKTYRQYIEHLGVANFDNAVDVPDSPMPFREPTRAEQIAEAIEKIKSQKQGFEVVEGKQLQAVKRQGSQFSNFVLQCLDDYTSDSE